MATLTLHTAGRLLATDNPRVKRGLLLPFNEPGRTNKGKLTAAAGTLTVPPVTELDPLTLEHDPKRPVARWLELAETPAGLECSIEYLPTTAGSDALAEYEAGARTGLSIEIDDLNRTGAGPVIRGGKVLAGLVTGGSQVVTPAFMSARLAAADVPDVPDQGDAPPDTPPEVTIDGATVPNVTAVEITPDQITVTTDNPEPPTDPNPEQESPMTASAPKLQAPNLAPAPPKDNKVKASMGDLATLLGTFHLTRDGKVLAALSDVTPTDILGVDQPQYIDEAWSGQPYAERYVPGFNSAVLTDFEIEGWRWKVKPEGDTYAGNNGAIATNEIETEAVGGEAERWAMGHGFDLKYKHFPRPSFWDSYMRAGAESFARWCDLKVLAKVKAAAPYVAPGTVPSGVSKGLAYIVDGVIAVLNETNTIPDGAYLSTDLWRELMLTRAEDALAYLNAMLGWEAGTVQNFRIQPAPELATDQALVKCRPAATVHRLGGAPIRVDALAIANGKVDEGMFGYQGVVIHNEGGLALVSGTAPVGP